MIKAAAHDPFVVGRNSCMVRAGAMVYVYLFAVVLGGILLGTSMILGGHDHDLQPGADTEGHDGGFESFLVWFLSIRFWTFFATFFGLTGLIVDALGLLPSSILTALLSIGVGLGVSIAAVLAFRMLRVDASNSTGSAQELIGKSGRVLVAFSPGSVGKVRFELRGQTVDLMAVPFDTGNFAVKDEVVVVDVDGVRVRVTANTASSLA